MAKAMHAEQPVALKVAGEAERLHVRALATVPVELLIIDTERDRLSRPQLPADPLWWLDAHDERLKVKLPSPARAPSPRSHIHR
jgi:hypothetical protein